MELQICPLSKDQRRPIPPFNEALGFGKYFSDHMMTMKYAAGKWQQAQIIPHAPLSLSPATMVFHYGQGIFEGLKAYRRKNDLFLFRPEKNLERFNRSAERLAMPKIDSAFLLNAIKTFVSLEKEWIPEQEGFALYLRPTMIATEGCLGVRPSAEYLFYLIASPVGAYYANGLDPVKIMVTEKYVRAAPGGIGEAKTLSNYAGALLAQEEGKKHGCNQVLWLDAIHREYLEEVGAMNIFVRFKKELATPNLTGTILPGVTRDSVLTIARSWNIPVNERKISIHEVLQGIKNGSVLEVFGTGTAAVVSPVGELLYKGDTYQIGDGKIGELSSRLFTYLSQLQVGAQADPFQFVTKF